MYVVGVDLVKVYKALIRLPTLAMGIKTLFSGAPKSLQMVIAAMKLKDAYSLEGKL